MFRVQDSDNFYVTRANALVGNVRLYHVIKGSRVEFASADRKVTSGEWHTLEATAKRTTLSVKWDGEVVITATDSTFAKGRIGLWTKADSVTAFDDLRPSLRIFNGPLPNSPFCGFPASLPSVCKPSMALRKSATSAGSHLRRVSAGLSRGSGSLAI